MTPTTTALLAILIKTTATTAAAISSYAWQMTAVAVIILLCLTWMVVKIRKRFRSGKPTTCSGCSMSKVCNSAKKNDCPTPIT